uniref:Cytochrome c oxidase subunit 3 n=1 Tax=Ancyrocephalus mogurndae TaxID=307077 RepID=A0A6M3RF97_9PLAT|nr:cytochrome c oxidase subunit 3 [Ancyrocephalus mogurndae]
MSWLPLFNSFSLFLLLVSAILWKLSGLAVFVCLMVLGCVYLWVETKGRVIFHFLDSFWMFILSEVIAFCSLLTCTLWFEVPQVEALSHFSEIPLFGCFLLLGSSITATAYHYTADRAAVSGAHILATLGLGCGFVLLQLVEFSECTTTILSSVYHACCFATVGLHFMHVVIGIGLITWLFFISMSGIPHFYDNLIIWYWHFVDYIWLLVYTVVYLC